MALGYLLLPHHLPEQFARLVDRILGEEDHAWVHLDARSDLDDFRARSSGVLDRPNVTMVARGRVPWAGYAFIQAALRGMRAALASGHPFTHLSLLSGQDYPLRPRAELAALLAARPDDGFMSHYALPGPGPGDELARVTHRFYTVAGRRFSMPNRYFPFPRPIEVPGGRTVYKGSAWWTLPRAMLEQIDDTMAAEPAIARLYARSFCGDESIFQTILVNSPAGRSLDQDTLRSIVFDNGAHSPRLLTTEDLPRLRAGGAFFARKFDVRVDARVLDVIDRELLGDDSSWIQSAAR